MLVTTSVTHASELSPYRMRLTTECTVFGSGLGLAALSEVLVHNMDRPTACEIENLAIRDINRFDRSAAWKWSPDARITSDYLVGACILVPSVLFLSHEVRKDAPSVCAIYLETIMISTFAARALKASGRTRPLAYNPDVSLEKKLSLKNDLRTSFPSSHTTLAFSSAVLVSTMYTDYFPESKWRPHVWVGSLLVASTVGYLRYASGYHFPTDVLAGAALGSFIGYMIPYVHRTANTGRLSVSPAFNQGRPLLAFECRF
jgi:membrane-associated phospholipid phosphatase